MLASDTSANDPAYDELIPMATAARRLPCRKAGKRTNTSTLHRWASHGCRGVRLKFRMIGSVRCTTQRWLDEFFDALTEGAGGEVATATQQMSKARQRELERVDAELARMGV